MIHDQVFVILLDESYNQIFDVEKECLTFFLRKHQKNCDIFYVQYFLD